MLSGDFNAILDCSENNGGSIRRVGSCTKFKKWVDDWSIMDLGFEGPKFTWSHGLVLERLDRLLCNEAWLDLFPDSRVLHLARIKSDHRPILLQMCSKSMGCAVFLARGCYMTTGVVL